MRGPLEEHVNRLYHFCLRLARDHHVAEDLTQEALLRAWRRRSGLRDPNATKVWLFKIATNLWRDRLRRSRHQAERPNPLGDTIDGSSRSPEHRLAERDELESVLVLVDTLPERQRQVLWLHALEGLSQAEIAGVLDIKASTVKVNLHHARRAMRRKLADGISSDGISAESGLSSD